MFGIYRKREFRKDKELKTLNALVNQLLLQNQKLHYRNELLYRIQRPGFLFIARVISQTGDLIHLLSISCSPNQIQTSKKLEVSSVLLQLLSEYNDQCAMTVGELVKLQKIEAIPHINDADIINFLDKIKRFTVIDLIETVCNIQKELLQKTIKDKLIG